MVEARRQVPQDINPHKDDSLSQRKAVALQKLDWVRIVEYKTRAGQGSPRILLPQVQHTLI